MPDCRSIAQISVMRSSTSNPFRILLTWITSLQRMCSATFVPSLPCVCHLLRISRLCGLQIGPRFLATLRSTKSTTAGSWHHPFGIFPCSSLACFVYLWSFCSLPWMSIGLCLACLGVVPPLRFSSLLACLGACPLTSLIALVRFRTSSRTTLLTCVWIPCYLVRPGQGLVPWSVFETLPFPSPRPDA